MIISDIMKGPGLTEIGEDGITPDISIGHDEVFYLNLNPTEEIKARENDSNLQINEAIKYLNEIEHKE